MQRAEVLMGLIGQEVAPIALAARNVKPVPADDLDAWERKLEQDLVNNSTIRETERMALIRARNGQGLFKERVSKIESRCRIMGVENPVPLVASHCKPWRSALGVIDSCTQNMGMGIRFTDVPLDQHEILEGWLAALVR